MFLRSLTLRGFKSFADRTTLEFTPGISVIVGPNGSGKSNLVDAISWVLGEQGPRALRGAQMADVIFAGSPARPALGMAEVKLVIDNTAGLIAVPLTELEISRTIFRSGDSEYRIAGQVVRLLDIQELLAETGIGRALHTVVGQGQLEDVLTARPEERRQYIEEAAGIAKHRRRKERAQRKLGSIEHDLLRLQDVLAELRRQLRPLKQQAEMAKRHDELSAQAREMSWRLAAARLRALYGEQEARRSGWEEGMALREAARERLAGLDRELAALAQGRVRSAGVLRAAQEALQATQEARSAAERALRESVERVAERRAAVARAATHTERLEAAAQDLARFEAALAQTEAALDARRAELVSAEEAERAAREARRAAEEERRALTEEAMARRAEARTLERSAASAERDGERVRAALARVQERIEAAERERDELDAEIERLDSEETPLAEEQAALERKRRVLAAEVAEREEAIRELEQKRSLLEARRRDLQETPGSRFIAGRPGRAAGLLRDLVRAPEGLEAAVAAALGPLSDSVVYEDRGAALADAPDADGVVMGVPGGELPTPVLPGERSLFGLVRVDARARPLAAAVLRDTYLAASLAEAEEQHRRHPRASFVTAEGVLVGPAVIRTAARVDARAEAVRRELQQLDHELATAGSALRPAAQRLEDVMAQARSVAEALERMDERITLAAERMSRLTPELSGLQKERDLLSERLAALDDSVDSLRRALASGAMEAPADPPPLPPPVEPPLGLRVEVETLRRERERLQETVARLGRQHQELAALDPAALALELEVAVSARGEAERRLQSAEDALRESDATHRRAADREREDAAAEHGANRAWRDAAAELDRLREEYEQQDRVRADLERRIAEAERVLVDGHNLSPEAAVRELAQDETPQDLERRSELVARRLALLGKVNLLAQGEFHALQERHDFLTRELDDVRTARRDLLQVVEQVDHEIVERFRTAFDDVAREFTRLFTELFPGGEGRLELTEPEDLLATGIDLEARPGRKRVKRISLLSGGERALTALAFLFAIFRARPSPFYLLDEVEAALDDVNLHRFLGLIRDFAQTSQVLVVTHQKRTMETADVLYGVAMARDGSTTVVAQRLEGSKVDDADAARPMTRTAR